ncbi:hypothetical protein M5K25_024041 [Dendrobium thyrsiflorum]|uniref:Uncharacterized protein n=1 Tax=Dendrobium thyrsiflorum TaxID=117978 RepID=A0ABD0U1A0_DENTH
MVCSARIVVEKFYVNVFIEWNETDCWIIQQLLIGTLGAPIRRKPAFKSLGDHFNRAGQNLITSCSSIKYIVITLSLDNLFICIRKLHITSLLKPEDITTSSFSSSEIPTLVEIKGAFTDFLSFSDVGLVSVSLKSSFLYSENTDSWKVDVSAESLYTRLSVQEHRLNVPIKRLMLWGFRYSCGLVMGTSDGKSIVDVAIEGVIVEAPADEVAVGGRRHSLLLVVLYGCMKEAFVWFGDIDHGFVLDNQGRTDILRSPFFDVHFGADETADDYVDKILYQLTLAIEQHHPPGHWYIINRPSISPDLATSSATTTRGVLLLSMALLIVACLLLRQTILQ